MGKWRVGGDFRLTRITRIRADNTNYLSESDFHTKEAKIAKEQPCGEADGLRDLGIKSETEPYLV